MLKFYDLQHKINQILSGVLLRALHLISHCTFQCSVAVL